MASPPRGYVKIGTPSRLIYENMTSYFNAIVGLEREINLLKFIPRPLPAVYNLLHFSMSSPYSSRWRRTMLSTKLERLLPLSPNLRTMKSARSCVSRFR